MKISLTSSCVTRLLHLLLLSIALFALTHAVFLLANYHIASDLAIFYESIQSFMHGRSLYVATDWSGYYFFNLINQHLWYAQNIFKHLSHNLNSPVFALFMLPFALLSYEQSFWCWATLNFLALLGAAKIIVNNLWSLEKRQTVYLGMLALQLFSFPIFMNFTLAEVGIFIYFIVILLWQSLRAEQCLLSAFWLSLLLSIKLFTGVFILLFLLQRRLCLLGYAFLFFIGWNFLALAVFGANVFLEYTQILSHVFWYENSLNVSLWGFWWRLFLMGSQLPSAQFMFLFKSIFLACALIVLGAWYKAARFFSKEEHFAFSLFIMLLFCPLGWVYYAPLLILPISMLFIQFANMPQSFLRIMIFVIAIFCLEIPYSYKGMADPHTLYDLLTDYSVRCYGVVLLAGLFYVVYTKPQQNVNHDAIGPYILSIFLWCALLPSAYLLISSQGMSTLITWPSA